MKGIIKESLIDPKSDATPLTENTFKQREIGAFKCGTSVMLFVEVLALTTVKSKTIKLNSPFHVVFCKR